MSIASRFGAGCPAWWVSAACWLCGPLIRCVNKTPALDALERWRESWKVTGILLRKNHIWHRARFRNEIRSLSVVSVASALGQVTSCNGCCVWSFQCSYTPTTQTMGACMYSATKCRRLLDMGVDFERKKGAGQVRSRSERDLARTARMGQSPAPPRGSFQMHHQHEGHFPQRSPFHVSCLRNGPFCKAAWIRCPEACECLREAPLSN